MIKRLLSNLVLLSLVACATTIGNRADLNNTTFVVGKTCKTDIVKTLGLPEKISKSNNGDEEYWRYTKGTILESVVIALPSPAGPSATGDKYTLPVGDSSSPAADGSITFVFNPEKILVKVIE